MGAANSYCFNADCLRSTVTLHKLHAFMSATILCYEILKIYIHQEINSCNPLYCKWKICALVIDLCKQSNKSFDIPMIKNKSVLSEIMM